MKHLTEIRFKKFLITALNTCSPRLANPRITSFSNSAVLLHYSPEDFGCVPDRRLDAVSVALLPKVRLKSAAFLNFGRLLFLNQEGNFL